MSVISEEIVAALASRNGVSNVSKDVSAMLALHLESRLRDLIQVVPHSAHVHSLTLRMVPSL